MARKARVYQKQFGVNAGASDVGVFGSLAGGSPTYSKDPATIMSLNAFLSGWAAETIGDNRPALEDFNALDFLAFYQLCYLFELGLAEWDASTTYWIGSICQDGTGKVYRSLADSNLNNELTNAAKWEQIAPFVPTAANALDGSIVQHVHGETNTEVGGTTAIPADNTTPTWAEGDNSGLDVVITPKSASNKLLILVSGSIGGGDSQQMAALCLFVDPSGTDAAVRTAWKFDGRPGGSVDFLALTHYMTAGSTSAKHFKLRFGQSGANASRILNGYGGSPLLNLSQYTTIDIFEIKAS